MEEAIKFIKGLDIDRNIGVDEGKKLLRLKYLSFCKEAWIKNTLKTYKQYNAAVRGIFGIDLPASRPRKEISPVMSQLDLPLGAVSG